MKYLILVAETKIGELQHRPLFMMRVIIELVNVCGGAKSLGQSHEVLYFTQVFLHQRHIQDQAHIAPPRLRKTISKHLQVPDHSVQICPSNLVIGFSTCCVERYIEVRKW